MTAPNNDAESKPRRAKTAPEAMTTANNSNGNTPADVNTAPTAERTTIPVVREELSVHKRTVETGAGVRVRKSAAEREEIVDEPLFSEDVTVEHVAVNQMIDRFQEPAVRHEGETMIIPVLEEVLVVEKRTMLKEEIHVTRKRREVHQPQTFILRTDEVSVDQFNDSVASAGDNPARHD